MLPTVPLAAVALVITGTALFTVKFSAFDAPPPGAGFVTTTAYAPAVPWSPALKVMLSCVALTYVAACPTPL